MNKTVSVSIIVAAVLVSGAVYLKDANITVPQQGSPVVQVTVPEQPAPVVNNNVSVPKQDVRLGAVPTLDGVDNPYVRIGGLGQYFWSTPTGATSSAICSIQNKYATTSIPLSLSLVGTNLMGATVVLDISTSTTQYGTSSPAFVKAFNLLSGGNTVVWGGGAATTTSSLVLGLTNTTSGVTNGASDVFIKAGEWVTFRVASSTPGTFANGYVQGVCSGVFQSLR